MVEVFTLGLLDEYARRKLFDDAPATLDDAKDMAMTCQRSQRATEYSRQAGLLHDMEERDIQPMEINQMAYQQHQALNNKIDALATSMAAMSNLMSGP